MSACRVLFLMPYPLHEAPSQRFRFAQYLDAMEKAGMYYECHSFLTDRAWSLLYRPGRFFRKFLSIANGFRRRITLMLRLHEFDYVFIHREASPMGPPIFEFFITRIAKKKVIFDFDDAIWLPNYSESNRFFAFLKRHRNSISTMKWAWKLSCGNDYLCRFASQYNPNVVYNPTTIDTENYHNRLSTGRAGRFVIGWTGSHSTTRYLKMLVPVLERLERDFDFDFIVIADLPPDIRLRSLIFRPWRKETEIEDLLSFTVGLMPLQEDPWSEGKCGFKALQYMSLGIPALVSPVGVNSRIVDHEVNGFICRTEKDWEQALRLMMQNEQLRERLSRETRKKIISHYSVLSNKENFLSLFRPN